MFYIIANDAHLRGKNVRKVELAEEVFARAGKQCEVLFTGRAGHAKELTEEITSSGENHTVVAMGGDGTLHEILNGFRDFENCAMGLIPLGTGNDFAASAGIPRDVKKAAEIIAFKQPEAIDFIETESGLRSLNAIGTGIDVEVLKIAYESKKRGKSKYLFALLKALKNYKGCEYSISADGKQFKKYAFIAAAGNGRQIGGGIKLFPGADIRDGKINLLAVDYLSRARTAAAFFKLMRGKVNKVRGAEYLQCTQFEITPQCENYTVQAEGELYDNVSLKAHIVAGGLKFYLP